MEHERLRFDRRDRRASTTGRAAAAAAAAGRSLHGLYRVAQTAQPRRVRRPFAPVRQARLRAPARGRQQATRRIPCAPRNDERDDGVDHQDIFPASKQDV